MTPEELKEWRTRVDHAIHQGRDYRERTDQRLDAMQSELQSNTAATKRVEDNTALVVEMMQSWQGAMRVLAYVGRAAKPMAYIVGLGTAMLTFWGALKGGVPK